MASSQKRRHSISLPPDLSDLTKELNDLASSFISSFNDKEPRMREIVEEFKKIANKVREMHQRTNVVRTGGAVMLGVAILAAPFTVGLSLAAAAAAAATATAGGGGAAVVIGANITKSLKENGSAKQVTDLGEEFMKIIEPMKNIMEAIKKTCEKQKSAEVQAERTLSDLQELESILRQVSELGRRSQEVLDLTVILLKIMNELVTFILSIFRVTATPEKDRKLTESIIQAADQSDKVINEFDEMRKELLSYQSKSLKF